VVVAGLISAVDRAAEPTEQQHEELQLWFARQEAAAPGRGNDWHRSASSSAGAIERVGAPDARRAEARPPDRLDGGPPTEPLMHHR
jgi:hypothetical protein